MKLAIFLSPLLAFAIYSSGQITNGALNRLHQLHPAVKWDSQSIKTADVNCDGKLDTLVIGTEKDNVVVAVVWGTPKSSPQLFSFPIRRDTQSGFCTVPKKIEVSPLDCESDEGTLPGCTVVKGCKSFTVIDDDCDPFNFYWDASRKTLAWWRM